MLVTILLTILSISNANASVDCISIIGIDNTTPNSQVYINGKYINQTNEKGISLVCSLKPGKHTIKIIKSGFIAIELPFEVSFSNNDVLYFKLTPFKFNKHKLLNKESSSSIQAIILLILLILFNVVLIIYYKRKKVPLKRKLLKIH